MMSEPIPIHQYTTNLDELEKELWEVFDRFMKDRQVPYAVVIGVFRKMETELLAEWIADNG